AAATALAALLLVTPACMPPSWGANALLHPHRRPTSRVPGRPFDRVRWQGDGVALAGWWFHAAPQTARGTIVYLHGVADSRGSSIGIADHFVPLGYDVVSYDSRAHGESEGDVSPVAAGPHITAPVLLIHGDQDRETPYDHSVRILAALHANGRLIPIPGGGHRGGLRPETWKQVDAWIAQLIIKNTTQNQ